MSRVERRPISGQQDGEMGEYIFVENPEPIEEVSVVREIPYQQTVHNVQKKGVGERARGFFRKSAIAGGLVVAALVVTEAAEFLPDFEAKKKLDIDLGAADSVVRENYFVNLAEVTSRFPLEVRTSLDRPGPINCDMKIVMTDEDEQVETVGNTGVIFDSYEAKEDEAKPGHYIIDVRGDMDISPIAISWDKTPILFESELSWSDRCYDMNEPNQAMDIAVTSAIWGGRLATACAIDSAVGERAIREGLIRDAISHGDIPSDITDENIVVNFDNLGEQQDAIYGDAVRAFNENVGEKIDQYLQPGNGSHKAETNFDGITDCSEHTYAFADGQNSSYNR